jgi:hypothetical protein
MSFGGWWFSNDNVVNRAIARRQFGQVGNAVVQIAEAYNKDNQVTQQLRYAGSPGVGVANSIYGLDNAGRVTSLLDTDSSLVNNLRDCYVLLE